MGNNLQGNRLTKGYFPNYHEKLANYGTIDVTKIEQSAINGHTGEEFHVTSWNVFYTIENSKCTLNLRQVANVDGKVNSVTIQVKDDMYSNGYVYLVVSKDSHFLASPTPFFFEGGFKNCTQKNNKTITRFGYVIETCALLYGSGSKRGLLVVVEKRKNGGNEKLCKITIAHYYAINNGNMFSQNKIYIGLSAIVKIQPSNEAGLNLTAEGPSQHPGAALHYMFYDVMKNGIWKPTTCPHCAGMDRDCDDLQSENEDCDEILPPQDGLENVKSIIANMGAVRGNNNGNLIVNKLYYQR